ncbi:hypothetical protein FLACOL7796_01832 [Flavobacterium collinsii]|uniref:Steroid 5-alpha reductase C-terminal domain-containing protein n=2 Tax=Flavobacteriaceae TaxID=49546 RepID=A0ABN7EI86_9FLAO|nr:hypothetical protein FLACOL7796_01832 [Flavobacterium collinsii]
MALQEEFEKQSLWLLKYGKTFPYIMLIVGYLLLLKSEKYPDGLVLRQSSYENLYEALCLGLSLSGCILRIITMGYTPSAKLPDHKGISTSHHYVFGAYSIVRHPLYLANFIIWLGMIIITGDFWFIIAFGLLYFIYLERIMMAKEKQLKSKFGFKYSRWAENVPAILPNVWLYKKPHSAFNWEKISQRETGRLCSTFFIFFVFEISCQVMEGKNNYSFVLLVISAIFGIIYIGKNMKFIISFIRRLIVKMR